MDPHSLESFTTCRLIPLDKNLGLQPIGIGETLRRIIGKAVSWTVKAAGTLHTIQVAAGLKSGVEATILIHAMGQIFDEAKRTPML